MCAAKATLLNHVLAAGTVDTCMAHIKQASRLYMLVVQ
jgi:hypothetical protein